MPTNQTLELSSLYVLVGNDEARVRGNALCGCPSRKIFLTHASAQEEANYINSHSKLTVEVIDLETWYQRLTLN